MPAENACVSRVYKRPPSLNGVTKCGDVETASPTLGDIINQSYSAKELATVTIALRVRQFPWGRRSRPIVWKRCERLFHREAIALQKGVDKIAPAALIGEEPKRRSERA